MNQVLIDKYNINFYNKVVPYIGGKEVEKIPATNHTVSLFLFEWSSEDINNYLIPNINDVISGTQLDFETGTEIMGVTVGATDTTFYLSGLDHDFPVMPTADFKEILRGWSEFLLLAPLNEAKI